MQRKEYRYHRETFHGFRREHKSTAPTAAVENCAHILRNYIPETYSSYVRSENFTGEDLRKKSGILYRFTLIPTDGTRERERDALCYVNNILCIFRKS